MRFIAAIDPGVTSGCVLVSVEPGLELAILDHKQITALPVLMSWLGALPQVNPLIIEDYLGAGHRTQPAVHTLQVIGAIQGWAAQRGQRVVMQPPQWRKAFVRAARRMLDVKHGGRHKADALAHILAHEYKRDRCTAPTA